MKRLTALIAGMALLAGGLVVGATPVSAATTWDFPSGTFTITDGLPAGQTSTGKVTVSNLQITGSTASGSVTLSNDRYSCRTNSFSDLSAVFSNPCNGTVTFSVDSAGVLSVSGSSVYIPVTLLNGPGTGSAPGIRSEITTCTVSVTGDQATVTWTTQGSGFTGFELGVANSVTSTPLVMAGGGDRAATVPLAGETPGPLTLAIEVNGDDKNIFGCPDVTYAPAPAKATIVGELVVGGSNVTVNYKVEAPTNTVQGIEYNVDGGPWARPGGTAPVGGVGGSFPISGLAAGEHTVTLQSIGFGSVAPTAGDSKKATIPSAVKPGSGTATGSSPSKPVPAPPAAPVSTIQGTSNGAGTGTNGALAATTGDAGIDAPCLAEDGTLYPNQYSTVGSQLTMAPNTHGLGEATSFTVIGGALPPGMQLDRTYGVLFGVTSQAGSWVTTVRAKLADGSTKTSQFTTRVDGDSQTLQYAAQNIGSVGAAIAIAPTTNAPVLGTTYELVCGQLPAGTRFDSRTGLITGTPTGVVSLPTPLRVAESSSSGRAAASFIFVVNKTGTTSFNYPAHPHVRAGKRVTIRPTVTGVGDIALFRMWKGKLPKGLRLSAATGVISGRVAHRGPTHTITVVAVTKGGALLTAAPMRLRLQR
jgi:hypothetical protein